MQSQTNTPVTENITREVRPFSSEYFLSFEDPFALWKQNWFAVSLELSLAVLLILVFLYAKWRGMYSTYLVLAAMLTTSCFEILPLLPRPGYVLWWYHPGIVNVLDRRVPSFVISLYAVIFFAAFNLTSQSNLPNLTRSFVTAFSGALVMGPCLWLGPRLLLLFLHFDDPVFQDKLFDVPFHQTLVIMLLFFHTAHLYQQNYDDIKREDDSVYSYLWCAVQTGLVGATYCAVEQYLLYIMLNLIFRTNTVFCLLCALLVLARLSRREMADFYFASRSVRDSFAPLKRPLWWALLAGFVFLSTVPLWLDAGSLRSTGTRLELGPCGCTHHVSNTSPLEIERRQCVCDEDADKLHFDFHCVPRREVLLGMQNKTALYTVCGKPIQEPKYVSACLALYSAVCLAVFYLIMLQTFEFGVRFSRPPEESKKTQ